MQVDLLDTMVSMYRSQGVSVHFFDASFENLSDMDFQFRQQMFPDYDYSCLIPVMESIPANTVCRMEDDLKLTYAIYHVSEALEQEYGIRHICLGPLLMQPITSKTFFSLMEQKQIHTDLYQEVQEFYNRVPLIADSGLWNHNLLFFLGRLSGSALNYLYLGEGKQELFGPFSAGYAPPADPQLARKAIEERYAREDDMLQAVAQGNYEQAVEAHYKFIQYKLMPRSSDAIRNRKNLLFTFNTLLRKAVQAAGVHPLHIDHLSHQLAVQIESASTDAQLTAIDTSMLRKYCMLVRNYSRISYSALIRTCLDYIDFHYMEELSLDYLARMCSVSSSYLSSLFKKETGTTITDCINSTRIRQSLLLLNSTRLSIQEIAEQCGFSDSNYFTRTFKRFQGKSPKSYRESIRKY